MDELAIIIPAYKIDFFDEALKSLANQTYKAFTVYVGIDASKEDFEAIANKYSEQIRIVCKRFPENLGGKDLVAQWNRCMALARDETWIMMFSDDDVLEPKCIEAFYGEREKGEDYDLYHYNVTVIDEKGKVIRIPASYPGLISSKDFLKAKCSARIESFVVEYVFRKKTFEEVGGFEHFDMAWGTDIATWAKIGRRRGIKTIGGTCVRWRQSSVNITPQKNQGVIVRKLKADSQFLIWCKDCFPGISESDIRYYMFRLLFHYSQHITNEQCRTVARPIFGTSCAGRMLLSLIVRGLPLMRFCQGR